MASVRPLFDACMLDACAIDMRASTVRNALSFQCIHVLVEGAIAKYILRIHQSVSFFHALLHPCVPPLNVRNYTGIERNADSQAMPQPRERQADMRIGQRQIEAPSLA